MKILECSMKGDKRFSARYAKVELFGVLDTIENHYQNAKYFKEKPMRVKGSRPDGLIVNGKFFDVKFLTPFYELLWIKYFGHHPELVEYAKQFDGYNDCFKGKSINCQADVIYEYMTFGKNYLYSKLPTREFLRRLHEK